jgi:hypothetical protein
LCPCPKSFLEPFNDQALDQLEEKTATAEGFIYDEGDVGDNLDHKDDEGDVDDEDDEDDLDDEGDEDYKDDEGDEDSSSSSECNSTEDGEDREDDFTPPAKRRKSTANRRNGSNHSWDPT